MQLSFTSILPIYTFNARIEICVDQHCVFNDCLSHSLSVCVCCGVERATPLQWFEKGWNEPNCLLCSSIKSCHLLLKCPQIPWQSEITKLMHRLIFRFWRKLIDLLSDLMMSEMANEISPGFLETPTKSAVYIVVFHIHGCLYAHLPWICKINSASSVVLCSAHWLH